MSIHDDVANPFVPYPVTLIRGAGKYVSPEFAQKSEAHKYDGKYDSLYVVKEMPGGKCIVADGPTGFHAKTEQIDKLWLSGGPLDWTEVVEMRAATGTHISDSDIDYINKGILTEHASIHDVHDESVEMSQDLCDEADIVERKRADLGFYNSTDILPAYAETEIGTAETPDEIRGRAEKILSDSESYRDECLNNLYEKVHALDVTDTRKFGDKVAGRSPRGGPAQLELLKPETRAALGPQYDEYHSQQISEHIHEIGTRNIERIRAEKAQGMFDSGLFGIDVSKKAVPSGPEKAAEKENVRQAHSEKDVFGDRRGHHYDDVGAEVDRDGSAEDDYGGKFG